MHRNEKRYFELILFQTINVHHSHARRSTVLMYCEETLELKMESIPYTRLGKVTLSSVIWEMTVKAGR